VSPSTECECCENPVLCRAAPDLLAALKGVVDYERGEPGWGKSRDAAIAAIARAEGGVE